MEDNGNVVETVGFRIQTNRETEIMVYTLKSIPINQIANQVEYVKNCYMRKGDIYYEYSAK